MPTPAMFYSQNKWPAASSPGAIGVRRFAIDLTKSVDSIDLHPAVAGPLMEMIKWWDQNIEPVKVIHGHNWREIAGKKGTGKLSNHASGTAIDINPDKHPLASEGTIPSKKRAALLAKAESLGLRWGGSYPGRKDEMHFEWIKSPQESPQVALTNSNYVPSSYSHWYTNPWFYAFALTTVATVVGTTVAISRRNRRERK
jgi:hypothetical protein